MTDNSGELIEYPSDFPIKIMGFTHDLFIPAMIKVVTRYDSTFHMGALEVRLSAKGNYTSLTATIRAISREQLDNLYRSLSSHPMVKMVF